MKDGSGQYLGCIEYLLDFTALEALAKAKEGAHRFVSTRTEAPTGEGS